MHGSARQNGVGQDGLTSATAISVLAALAQPSRLEILRLLMKYEPDGIPAGAIAGQIGAPHNTTSTHLAILVRAGLLRSARNGRTIIYRADLERLRELVAFLVHDCCDGRPELCNLLSAAPTDACGCAPEHPTHGSTKG